VRPRGSPGHLARRFVGSLSNRRPSRADLDAVAAVLDVREHRVWTLLQGRDQRHSIQVWRRFLGLRPDADIHEQRAALLHDVGKIAAPIGPCRRAAATLLGPVTPKFRRYLEHEHLGRDLLAGVSAERTLEILAMPIGDPAADALRAADDV